MSSDYLLKILGYDPTEADRRLGDGRYESRLIADAVRTQTGQRFLADSISSDYEQFQYLMDNAVASKDALGLSFGVGLTSEQVAALTHDIVWMEERVVEGETVLTPVLYLAKVDSRNLRGGSLVQGRNIEMITGGDLKNVGTLRASEDMTLLSGGSIFQGGLTQANNNLTMLATNSIRNALAGEIRGDKINLTTLTGDITNDRTATQLQVGAGSITAVDAGSSITAGSELTINSANDLTNKGQISSGGNAALTAGHDINLLAVQDRTVTNNALRRGMRTEETITQLGSSVTAKGDLTLKAGNDINALASKASAGQDLEVEAGRDVNLMSAADEHNLESRYKKGKKKVHEIDDQSRQVASEFTAGRDLSVDAKGDVTLVASNLKAGDEAYVYAGNNLNLLAAQNSDYTLYDMKKKGGWGSKKNQRDEVTQLTNIGSQVTTGGDLTLKSGGDQRYQVAKLNSGNDLTIDSGGAITFEGVKDLHDESHTKSDNNAFWTSSKGKGNTDETLRQTQMIAKGELTIKAVNGLKIDIKEVNEQTVSQTIDAMVKADPQLAWLKEAEKRGDVDWRQVKEIHESFKYSTSGLGPASQLIIAIMLSMVMGPMMATWTTMAQAGTIAVATKATVSTIDNRGNLGAVFKDVTSKDSLKGYAVSMATAGVADGLNYSPGKVSFTPESLKTVAIKVAADAAIKTAVYGGSFQDNLASSLAGTAASIGGAYGAGKIGDLELAEGSLEKIALHAALGGLLAEAMGGDFRTGAIAGGANEALVGVLGSTLLPQSLEPGTPEYLQAQANLVALSKIVGVLGAVASNGDINIASEVAANATQNNYLNHTENNERFKAALACSAGSQEACARRDELDQLDSDRDKALWAACNGAAQSSACTEKRMEAETARIDLLKHKNTPEAREQILLAFKNPELLNYTLVVELRGNQKLEDAIFDQVVASVSKSLLSLGADMTPVVGTVKGYYEAEDNWDYLFASVGLVPGLGGALSKGLAKVKALLKQGKAQEASDLLESLAKYEAGAKGSAFAGKNIDDLSNAGKLLDPADKSGQLSLAGRALQKHGSREGSAFPSVKGSPSEINAQGQKIADEILSNPATTVTYKDTGRFGKVMDVIAPDGRGLRYDSNGKFIGLLEPPKP